MRSTLARCAVNEPDLRAKISAPCRGAALAQVDGIDGIDGDDAVAWSDVRRKAHVFTANLFS